MSSDLVSSEVPPRHEQDGEVVADAIVEASAFEEFLEAIQAVADEAKIHFNDEGLSVRAVDPAQVSMVYVDLGTEAFETYDAGAVTIGVDLNRLADQVGLADAGDLIRVRVDMETRKLRLSISEHIHPTIGLIDPDSIRKEPDLPELDLPNEAHLSTDRLDEAIGAIDLLFGSSTSSRNKAIQLGWDDAEESLVFYGEGDTDSTRVEYDADALEGGSHFDEATASLFALDYWENLAGAIPSDTETLSMEFGEDFPTIWEWEAQDGALEVTNLCAPRISTD